MFNCIFNTEGNTELKAYEADMFDLFIWQFDIFEKKFAVFKLPKSKLPTALNNDFAQGSTATPVCQ